MWAGEGRYRRGSAELRSAAERPVRQPALHASSQVDRSLASSQKLMNPTSNPVRLYTDRSRDYVRFVRFVRYPQGIRAYFLGSPRLRSGLRVLDAGCGTGIVTTALREALVIRGFNPGPLQGFDLTPAMLERFRQTLRARAIVKARV